MHPVTLSRCHRPCERCLLPAAMDPLILEPDFFLVVLLKLALNHGVITTMSGLLLRGCQSEPWLLKLHTTRSSARQHRDSSLTSPTVVSSSHRRSHWRSRLRNRSYQLHLHAMLTVLARLNQRYNHGP
ncbi:hypothetical protein Bca4012_037713 [Brassica carinata]